MVSHLVTPNAETVGMLQPSHPALPLSAEYLLSLMHRPWATLGCVLVSALSWLGRRFQEQSQMDW